MGISIRRSKDLGSGSFTLPSGIINPFAGITAPDGWLLCYGQAISRTVYSDLFIALSTTYGVGDGSTTFNIPDMRGRVVAGEDDMGGTAANRLTSAVSGVAGTTLGAVGGSQLVQQHSHANTVAITGGAHTHQINGGSVYSAGGTGDSFARSNTGGDPNFRSEFEATTQGFGSTKTTHTHTATHTAADYGTGSSANVPPTIILNYIIKV
jgi:microcystin-dependent protein